VSTENPLPEFLAATIVALARTWDTKLPGFLAIFQAELDNIYVQTPSDHLALRNLIDKLSVDLGKRH
jgi:hypothetical protein